MKNNKKWIGLGVGLACLVLCLVLLLAMCGGGGEEGPETTGQTQTTGSTEPEETTASTEETTEATTEATEPTEEETEHVEETTEPTSGSSGNNMLGNFTGGSVSTGSGSETEETTPETEPKEEEPITVSVSGAQENPYAEALTQLPAAFSTVKIPAGGQISYYLYHGAGTVLTVEDENVYILYNGVTYSPVDGVVTVALEADADDAPAALVVGSKAKADQAYTLNFVGPVGSASNPQILETLDQLQVSLEAGNGDGYHFTWTADKAGRVTFTPDTVEPEDAAYDILVTLGETTVRLSECEDGCVPVDVSAGDVITIQVVTLPDENGEYPAAEIAVKASFEESAVAEPELVVLEDGVTYTLTIPAGGAVRIQADATGKTMDLTVDGGRMYYDWYVQLGETQGKPVASGIYTTEIAGEVFLATIYNNDTENPAVLNVTAASRIAGTLEDPLEAVTGENTAQISTGSEGCYYSWIAEKDGVLTVTMDEDNTLGWQFFVNNLTAGIYGDTHWSDDEPLVDSESLTVSAGDQIQIWVSTYDPASPSAAPEGEVAFHISFTADGQGGEEDPTEPEETEPTEPSETEPAQPDETEPTEPGVTEPTEPSIGTETEPYILEDGVSQTLTVPAGGVIWVQADATGKTMDLTVDGSRMYYEWYILVGTEIGTPNVACVYRTELVDGVYLMPIYNTSEDTDAVLTVLAASPVPGSAEYPIEIGEMGAYQASVAEGGEGVYYTWTAEEDGTLTVTIDTETGWMYSVNNETTGTYGDIHWSDDDPIVSSQDMTVTAGDQVTIWVSTYDPENPTAAPAGEVDFHVSFTAAGEEAPTDPVEPTDPTDPTEPVEPDGTETNPYILEDGVTYELTLPADGVIWVQVDATKDVMTLTVDGYRIYPYWKVEIDGELHGPYANGTYVAELSGGVYVIPIYSITSAMDAVLKVTASSPVFGTIDNPEILENAGTQTVTQEAGGDGYFYNYTAKTDGTVTVEIDTEKSTPGWQYFMNIPAKGLYGDTHWSDDDTVVSSETRTVSAGDVVEIWACPYDPAIKPVNPAGTVVFTLRFVSSDGVEEVPTEPEKPTEPAPEGSEENPYVLEDDVTQEFTIPAGESIYVQVDATGTQMTLNVQGQRQYPAWHVMLGENQYTPYIASGLCPIELEKGQVYVLAIVNDSAAYDITLEATALSPESSLGSVDDPEILEEMGSYTAVLKGGEDDYAYYYEWTAEADGTLTVTIDTEKTPQGWQFKVNNLSTGKYSDPYTSGNGKAEDAADYVAPAPTMTITVKKGNKIQICVATYDPENDFAYDPGEVSFSMSFEEATEENK